MEGICKGEGVTGTGTAFDHGPSLLQLAGFPISRANRDSTVSSAAMSPGSSKRSQPGSDDLYPRYRSHFLPRTAAGRGVVILFLALLALAEPPVVHQLVNRVEPWVGGLPFLYAWLLAVYVLMIGVLLWAVRRGL